MMDDPAAQAARAQAGKDLETIVAKILNLLLNEHKIYIVRGNDKSLSDVLGASLAEQVIDYSKLPVKRPCDQHQIEDYPDSDLFVIYKNDPDWRVLAVISCKVSFHSRHTMVAFWGLAIRVSSNMKYVCVTEDADIYRSKRSELGKSCMESTAARRILESFTARTYIIKQYKSPENPQLEKDVRRFLKEFNDSTRISRRAMPCFDDPHVPNHTDYCPSVCPLDELYFDALRWRDEAFAER
jgi:hypothetical protein